MSREDIEKHAEELTNMIDKHIRKLDDLELRFSTLNQQLMKYSVIIERMNTTFEQLLPKMQILETRVENIDKQQESLYNLLMIYIDKMNERGLFSDS